MFRRLNRSMVTFFKRAMHTHIVHVTDFEGVNLFVKNMQASKVVDYKPDSGLNFRRLTGKPYFICGGDVTDRGSQDLELLEMLVDFKKRYPENVSLLVGNREIKQCRFKTELDPIHIKTRLLFTKQPRWIKDSTSPKDYVAMAMKRSGLDTVSPDAMNSFVGSLSVEECQLIYLKWMLEKTMGCPHSFRYRREELTRLRGEAVTDIEVLNSFIKEAEPNGLVGQYLRQAQVAVIVPHTQVLAVHGGLTADNIGKIPGNNQFYFDARQWVAVFNDWYKAQIENWRNSTAQGLTIPANTPLDESVLPIPGKVKFAITADMLDSQRKFVNIPSFVNDYLYQNNISCLLTGHQPCGDYPAILRGQNTICINGDTGYAKISAANPDDTRGSAHHLLEITANLNKTEVLVKGTLSDETQATTRLVVTPAAIKGNPYVGLVTADNCLVQCELPNNHYRLAQQEGFNIKYTVISEADLLLRLSDIPALKF